MRHTRSKGRSDSRTHCIPAHARKAGLVAPAAFCVAAIATALPLSAQEPGFTLERIHASTDFAAENFSAHWMSDGRTWARLEADAEGAPALWLVDVLTGERNRLIEADELLPPGGQEPIAVESYTFSEDERRVLLFTNSQQVWRARTKGTYYVFDLETRLLAPVSRADGWQMFAKLSPDGRYVAFVRDHDLFVTDLITSEELRLTSSGSDDIINGTTDWVYEEELSLRDAFRWSPDGKRIAYWQLDQSAIQPFYMIDETELYPEIVPVRYPKAGTPNSTVRVGSLELATGETTWFDIGSESDIYIARMEWAASSDEVVIQRLNRHQNRLDLLLGDAGSGATEVILTETDDAWVDVHDHLTWLDDGRRFLWSSERDGWRHFYLYERDGTLVRQLTSGEWEVSSFFGVDQATGRVYFSAPYESPLTRAILTVGLEGGEAQVLAGGRGWHSASFSPDFTRAIQSHSTADTPPITTLQEVGDDGLAEVRKLADNGELTARLTALGLGTTEFMTVAAADGTPLHAYMIKPADFDPTREYGLLMYVYGGPGSGTVADRWGGSRSLWFHYLAQRGILVASVDNRGTGARGRDFKKQTYLKLGQLETADQLAAARQFGSQPYVDAGRIGIWGWSYGGYMALMATLLNEGEIAAAVSVAPVTHWGLYDSIYTERFMRTPGENPEGYELGSPLTHAERLNAELLIIHGTGDDNVHSQNTLQMIERLEEADRQFDMRFYPNKRHGISGDGTRVNLHRLITGFVLEHLGPDAADRSEPATS